MLLNSQSPKPIYIQIADWMEDEILNGNLKEEERVYSQYQLAEMFNINPATAAKGLSNLADKNIVYKKRGLGMFVTLNARQMVLEKRKSHGLGLMIRDLIIEARRLNIDENDLLELVKKALADNDEGGDKI